jgi:hypothetical protein
MDKDKAIITQVCAKIAADLTDKTKEWMLVLASMQFYSQPSKN